jgi:hypothetical protein
MQSTVFSTIVTNWSHLLAPLRKALAERVKSGQFVTQRRSENDSAEPSMLGCVAQALPAVRNCRIHPLGFPPSKKSATQNRPSKPVCGPEGRIPKNVAMAQDVKRRSRAIWLCAPILSEPTGADSYLVLGRYPIYIPEFRRTGTASSISE